jgi:molybdate transport system regulatory protein
MFKPRFNLWIEKDGAVVISQWRARLLRAIDQTGSITAAAEALDVPYRRAWERVQEMEQCLGDKLVLTEVGGTSGGGAQLTAEARMLLSRFDRFAKGFEEVVQARFLEGFNPNP